MIRRPIVGLAFALTAVLLAVLPRAVEPADAPPTAGVQAQWRPEAEPRPGRVSPPVRIEIDSIGVRARVIPLGLNRDRTLEVPANFGDTGWWTGGARPGERGPAVIAGHFDSRTGPAVFFRLGDLAAGDPVVVLRRDGSRVRFVVRRAEHYAKARFPTARVYGPTRRASLRLITCSGQFDRDSGHYLDNTVVYAERG